MQIGFLRCWTGGIRRRIIDSSRDAEAKNVGDLSEMSAVQLERPNGVPLLLNPGKHQGGITAKYIQVSNPGSDWGWNIWEVWRRFLLPLPRWGPNPRPRCLATKCPSSFSWSFWGFTLKLPLLNRGPFLGVSANVGAHWPTSHPDGDLFIILMAPLNPGRFPNWWMSWRSCCSSWPCTPGWIRMGWEPRKKYWGWWWGLGLRTVIHSRFSKFQCYPLVNKQFAIENGHWNSWFTH